MTWLKCLFMLFWIGNSSKGNKFGFGGERGIINVQLETKGCRSHHGHDALFQRSDVRRLITIKRNDKTLFRFTIAPIDEDVWSKCRRQNLRNKGKRSEELDNARFLAQAIYEATVEDDKDRLWRNDEVWKKLHVASGIDVVNMVLTPGEKAKIGDVLTEISGYDEEDLDTDFVKNV